MMHMMLSCLAAPPSSSSSSSSSSLSAEGSCAGDGWWVDYDVLLCHDAARAALEPAGLKRQRQRRHVSPALSGQQLTMLVAELHFLMLVLLLLLLLLFYCPARIHVYIEDMLADEQLISLMQDLLLLSDRAKLADLPALAASG